MTNDAIRAVVITGKYGSRPVQGRNVTPWLAAFQPKINWKEAVLDESMQPVVIKTIGLNTKKEVARIRNAWVERAEALANPGEEIHLYRVEESKLK